MPRSSIGPPASSGRMIRWPSSNHSPMSASTTLGSPIAPVGEQLPHDVEAREEQASTSPPCRRRRPGRRPRRSAGPPRHPARRASRRARACRPRSRAARAAGAGGAGSRRRRRRPRGRRRAPRRRRARGRPEGGRSPSAPSRAARPHGLHDLAGALVQGGHELVRDPAGAEDPPPQRRRVEGVGDTGARQVRRHTAE